MARCSARDTSFIALVCVSLVCVVISAVALSARPDVVWSETKTAERKHGIIVELEDAEMGLVRGETERAVVGREPSAGSFPHQPHENENGSTHATAGARHVLSEVLEKVRVSKQPMGYLKRALGEDDGWRPWRTKRDWSAMGRESVTPREESDFLAALARGRSHPGNGTRPDLRRWLAQRYMETQGVGVTLDFSQRNAPVPEPSNARLLSLVRAYLQFYFDWSRQHAKQLMFVHVSKSGGTSFCGAREGLPEHVCFSADSKLNCLTPGMFAFDGPSWFIGGLDRYPARVDRYKGWSDHRFPARDDCGLRMWMLNGGTPNQYLNHLKLGKDPETLQLPPSANKTTFYSIEKYLPGGDTQVLEERSCKGQELAMIVVRDPLARMRAHFRNIGIPAGYEAPKYGGDGSCSILSDYPTLSRNYLTRTLLGAHVYLDPLQDLDEGLLQTAMRILQQMDFIGLTSDMSSPIFAESLQHAFAVNMSFSKRLREGVGKNSTNSGSIFGDCTVEYSNPHVVAWTLWDVVLFQFAADLAQVDKLFWTELFAEAVTRAAPDDNIDMSSQCLSVHKEPLTGRLVYEQLSEGCGIACAQ